MVDVGVVTNLSCLLSPFSFAASSFSVAWMLVLIGYRCCPLVLIKRRGVRGNRMLVLIKRRGVRGVHMLVLI